MTTTTTLDPAEFSHRLDAIQSQLDALKALERRVSDLEGIMTQVLAGLIRQLDVNKNMAARIAAASGG